MELKNEVCKYYTCGKCSHMFNRILFVKMADCVLTKDAERTVPKICLIKEE